jgi:hypothetical protein
VPSECWAAAFWVRGLVADDLRADDDLRERDFAVRIAQLLLCSFNGFGCRQHYRDHPRRRLLEEAPAIGCEGRDDVLQRRPHQRRETGAARSARRRKLAPVPPQQLNVNKSGRPAYIEFICRQYPVYGQWVGRSAE